MIQQAKTLPVCTAKRELFQAPFLKTDFYLTLLLTSLVNVLKKYPLPGHPPSLLFEMKINYIPTLKDKMYNVSFKSGHFSSRKGVLLIISLGQ